MNWQRGGRAVVIFGVLLVLHFFVRPLLPWRITADFLVVAVLLMAVRVRPGVAAIVGFSAGLVADSLSPAAFGAAALALTLIGFAASWLKAVFFSDNILLHAFFFFLGKWTFDVIYVLAERQRSAMEVVTQLLLWSPLAAGATALGGLLVLMLFRGMLETSGP